MQRKSHFYNIIAKYLCNIYHLCINKYLLNTKCKQSAKHMQKFFEKTKYINLALKILTV